MLENVLTVHCIVMALVIALAGTVLFRRRLVGVLYSGPWLLFAASLYFLFNPAYSLVSKDLSRYVEALELITREGAGRAFWVLATVVVGMASWLIVYVAGRNSRTESALVLAPAARGGWSPPQVLVLAAFFAVATYSLLFLRTRGAFVDTTVVVEFDGGNVVGGATGYSVIAHGFFLFILVLLLYRGPQWARVLAGMLFVILIGMRLFDPHDRSSIVALMAAAVMVVVLQVRSGALSRDELARRARRHRGKIAVMLAGTLLMTWFLIGRGHKSVREIEAFDWEGGREAVRRNDTAMLPVFYVTSYLNEGRGWDYGIPLINRAMFGWLPRKYFPWKDSLPTVLLDEPTQRMSPSVEGWLFGTKDTVMGSFYRHGGIVAVCLGMALLGWLMRKLDRLVAAARTDLARAVGVVWLANLWMMFASSDIWILGNVFINGLPFFGMYAAMRVGGVSRRRLVGAQLPKGV